MGFHKPDDSPVTEICSHQGKNIDWNQNTILLSLGLITQQHVLYKHCLS